MLLLSQAVLLSLLSAVLALPQAIQLPFSSTSSLSLPSQFPASLSTQLDSAISQLPLDHLLQLQDHVTTYDEPRTVTLRDGARGIDSSVSFTLTEGEKSLLTLLGIRYIDTSIPIPTLSSLSAPSYPSHLSHNLTSLSPLLKSISIPSMKSFLSSFTSFRTRYYRSQTGRESQLFLLNHLKELHATLNPNAKVSFREFKHSNWDQRSIIVRWEPSHSRGNYSDEVVMLSAHQDSTNSLPFLPAPGADDDASGTVTLIETFTSLLTHKFEPTSNPIEFAFFSAEEGGLLGSGEVAREYANEGKKVKGLFHMDVVAYVKPGTTPAIGLITDGVNLDLVEFMKLLINEYATIPYVETQCGYGCSDFASFTKAGYPSTCLAEGKFADSNPHMHSMQDTTSLEGYSFEHIVEYVRVAIGYAVELGGMEKGRRRGKDGKEGKWRMD